jgi:SAM-dependent methyltransferase
VIEADFDRIALLPEGGFDNSAPYHGVILRAHGSRAREALDIGCGTGRFTRLLAARADRVLGIDLSAKMIAAARRRSETTRNVTFQQADVLNWEWPRERFDFIVSIATLHHLPMEEMLIRMRVALRPGGTLAVLDICRVTRLHDAIAFPWSVMLRCVHTGRPREEPEARRLWTEHAKNDRYLNVKEVRRICLGLLPGARVRQHLLWRYSLIWRKSS